MPVTRAALDSASRAALRAILSVRPDANAIANPAFVSEQINTSDPPLLSQAETLEPGRSAPVDVGEGVVGFSAFLDGTQNARILAWVDGVPYLFGVSGAVVRHRHERRLHTWREPLLQYRLYVPLAYTRGFDSPREGLSVIDTTAAHLGAAPSRHPAALLERALVCLQRDRELLEQRLAAEWVAGESGVVCVDGPLPAAGPARSSVNVIGAVKTHRTIYAEGAPLDLILGLEPGQRSPAFRVVSGSREPVASWYLRTRDARGRDALWGLVRLESVIDADVSRRADTVSRWLLAENAPLALPDGRWDKMTYGVRSCEAFLRAVS
jgi:hypothetical protein